MGEFKPQPYPLWAVTEPTGDADGKSAWLVIGWYCKEGAPAPEPVVTETGHGHSVAHKLTEEALLRDAKQTIVEYTADAAYVQRLVRQRDSDPSDAAMDRDFADWFSECMYKSATSVLPRAEVSRSFFTWAADNGRPTTHSKFLFQWLEENGITKSKRRGNWYLNGLKAR